MNQITIRFEAKFDNPDGTKDGVFLTFDKEGIDKVLYINKSNRVQHTSDPAYDDLLSQISFLCIGYEPVAIEGSID